MAYICHISVILMKFKINRIFTPTKLLAGIAELHKSDIAHEQYSTNTS